MLKCEHIEETNKHDTYYWYPDGLEAGYLCETCATNQGFCPNCGRFVGGIDMEIPFINDWGMCHECYEDLLAELGETSTENFEE